MHLSYDEEADVLFVEFGGRTPNMRGSRDFGGERWVEFNADDAPIAVEFLDASHGVDLAEIPYASDIRDALRRLSSLIDAQVHTPA